VDGAPVSQTGDTEEVGTTLAGDQEVLQVVQAAVTSTAELQDLAVLAAAVSGEVTASRIGGQAAVDGSQIHHIGTQLLFTESLQGLPQGPSSLTVTYPGHH